MLKKSLYILILIIIFGGLFFGFSRYNRNFEFAIPLIGDEPSYLAIADSLVTFKTFNQVSEIQSKHYQNFFHQDTTLHTVDLSPTQRYPKHGIGWPLLLAPLFYITSDPRYLAMFLQTAIVALLALNIFLWLKEEKYNFYLSVFVAFVVVLSLPIAVESHFLFSEPLAALLLVYALRKYENPTILSALAIAFLPWIHIKYLVFYPILLWPFFKFHLKFWQTKIRRIIPLIIVLLSFAGIIAFNYYAYKTPFSGQEKVTSFFSNWGGLIGSLVNLDNGLFPSAPVYILSLLGLGALLGSKKKIFWRVFLTTGFLWFLNGVFQNWDGGQAPSARMILAILPVLAIPLAEVLVLPLKWVFRTIFMVLASLGLILAFQGQWMPVITINKNLYPNLNFFQNSGIIPIDLEKFFPWTHHLDRMNITWIAILVGLFALGFLLVKFRKKVEKVNEIIDYNSSL